MKALITTIMVCWVSLTGGFAQQAPEGVGVAFKNVRVTFYGDPQRADGKLHPVVVGDISQGSKERFGLCLGGMPSTARSIEILDKNGAVLKGISLAEVLSSKASTSLMYPQGKGEQPRWLSKVQLVDLPGGKAQLSLRALATGDGGADQHLVLTLGLKTSASTALAVRVTLPVVGAVEGSTNGFVLGPKKGAAAIAAAVYPGSATASSSKEMVTVTSPVVTLEPGRESALFWIVFDGVSGTSNGDARQQASKILRENRYGDHEPRIVVISSADRRRTQPGDTVTYTIICKNIGTAAATDVKLSNPVSEGTQYLEGSATSDGSTVSIDRGIGGPGGPVRQVSWILSAPVDPGAEHLVSFKVRVR